MRFIFSVLLLILLPVLSRAATWRSEATNSELRCEILEPTTAPGSPKSPLPVVIYLENLAAPRVGTDSDEAVLRDFRTAGYLVVALDYARHPQARAPFINRDFVALRHQLQKKTLLADHAVDASHIFIVPSGHRLQRDVVFYRETNRTLAMDIIYPSHPAQPVGAVLEFSCDNAARMGNYSLDSCADALLAGAATEGLAVAMADHPVAAPYEGLDPMPDCARKIKAAVRTLRAEGATLGLNGRIVAAGFSRGSGLALMLATTAGMPEFDGYGEHPGIDGSVQGAVVMSGRFTYLDLLANDPMIPRYEKTWGPRATHPETWRAHGALDFLEKSSAFPLFLTINVTESPDALHQMEVLRLRLTELHSPFEYRLDEEPRGHKMPLAAAVLDPLLRHLGDQLSATPSTRPASFLHP